MIAKLASAAGVQTGPSDYWLCQDAEQPPAPSSLAVVASAPPALVDLGEAEGTVVWSTSRGLAIWRSGA
jgi:hypothetical protein